MLTKTKTLIEVGDTGTQCVTLTERGFGPRLASELGKKRAILLALAMLAAPCALLKWVRVGYIVNRDSSTIYSGHTCLLSCVIKRCLLCIH